MRVTLTVNEANEIINILEKSASIKNLMLAKKIREQCNKPVSELKRNATKKATLAKQRLAKTKIQNTVNIMRLENEKMTAYKIAKKSGVSFSTVKKYSYIFISDITFKKINRYPYIF